MNKPKPFIHQAKRDDVYCVIIGRMALPLGFVAIVGTILVAFALFGTVYGLVYGLVPLLIPAGIVIALLLAWLGVYTVGLLRRVNRKDLA
ncbi:membrane protein [Microbacterium phage Zooman]|nr:membrane protein [Microbacterium phage Zooman]